MKIRIIGQVLDAPVSISCPHKVFVSNFLGTTVMQALSTQGLLILLPLFDIIVQDYLIVVVVALRVTIDPVGNIDLVSSICFSFLLYFIATGRAGAAGRPDLFFRGGRPRPIFYRRAQRITERRPSSRIVLGSYYGVGVNPLKILVAGP